MPGISWGGQQGGPPLGRHLPPQGSQPQLLTRPSWPLEGCFSIKRRQQSAHGHSSGHMMMRLARRGDVRATDTLLMIKGDTALLSPPNGLRDFPLWCKRESWRYAPSRRQQRDPPRSPVRAGCLSVRTVAFLLPLLSLLSWTKSMICTAAVD